MTTRHPSDHLRTDRHRHCGRSECGLGIVISAPAAQTLDEASRVVMEIDILSASGLDTEKAIDPRQARPRECDRFLRGRGSSDGPGASVSGLGRSAERHRVGRLHDGSFHDARPRTVSIRRTVPGEKTHRRHVSSVVRRAQSGWLERRWRFHDRGDSRVPGPRTVLQMGDAGAIGAMRRSLKLWIDCAAIVVEACILRREPIANQ